MLDLTQTFIDALHRLETERDVAAIAGLFADNAEIANPLVQYESGGPNAAKTFWSQYRDAFEEIRSEFRTVSEKDGTAFLEWTSKGSIDGKPFTYEGVSILETGGDKISAFRSYFDTRHIPTARSKGGENTGRVQLSSQTNGGQTNGGQNQTDSQASGNAGDASEEDMVQAQRDAAEQRAGGGYS
ncbi:nuclear transport factor 2 family protein [Rhizobium deserti]|uniref:Nuclear transport factor 2 family protein n=1 Tax=Rhizobium deserti TaxID=2547961 RepID=A0A4R5UJ25_9HYPH|nr:nuclear transport factor 2 family protein [Rhizobium deserti]TDK36743.1 nuclear transport factor 2 family protein [Rhizobium deserti]